MGFGSNLADVGKSAWSRVSGSIEKAYLYVNKDPKNPMKKHKFIVKYNPSTLRISALAGTIQSSGVGASGINQITQMTIEGQVQLQVDLILEDLNNMDAFMADKMLLNGGAAQTATSAVSGIVKTVKGKGYSIQDETEAFVGLLMSPKYRKAELCWGNMSFAGEITGVSAQYTMFNPIGNPVRSVIHMTMQQNGAALNTKYWNDALDEVFSGNITKSQLADGSNAASYKDIDNRDGMSFVQNLLNF